MSESESVCAVREGQKKVKRRRKEMDFILFLCQTINIHKPSQYGENTKFVKLLEAISNLLFLH